MLHRLLSRVAHGLLQVRGVLRTALLGGLCRGLGGVLRDLLAVFDGFTADVAGLALHLVGDRPDTLVLDPRLRNEHAGEESCCVSADGGEREHHGAGERRLTSGQRLILVTDGIIDRRTESGTFGIDGIREALSSLPIPTAAATAMAILHAVTDCWKEPLEDDGTVVCLCIN